MCYNYKLVLGVSKMATNGTTNGVSHKLPFPDFIDPGLPSKCTWKPGTSEKDPHSHVKP